MALRFNPNNNEFFLITNDADRAKDAGMTLSTSIRGPAGEGVYFTDSAYAALPFYREADPDCANRLAPLWDKYQRSWAVGSTNTYPYGQMAKDMGLAPMDFQNAGVDYMLEQDNSVCGDSMGLGKSMQAVLYDNAKGHEHNLIVAPANTRPGWKKQCLLWSVLPSVRVYPIYKGSDGVNPYANYTIVSYELLQNPGIHQAIYQQKWDSIHIDEIHYLKTPDAKRTYAMFGGGRGIFAKQAIADRAKTVNGYTGTLLPNRPRECFTTVKNLGWQAIDYMGLDDFAYRFNPRGQLENGHWIEAKGRLPELQARLRCNLMVRRLKEDVLKDLPDIRYELTYLEPDGAIQEVLMHERMLDFKPSDLKNPMAEIWGQISTIRKEMGLAALPQFIKHIRFLLDVVGVEKVTVFSWHREVMDRMYEALNERYGVVEVRGGLSPHQKEAAVNAFVNDPNKRVFHGQIIAAGTGIDGLQSVSSHCVVTEPDWVPGNNEQVFARLHRIGQHDNVIAQMMCVEGSIIERILAAAFTKLQGIHQSLDDRIQGMVMGLEDMRMAA